MKAKLMRNFAAGLIVASGVCGAMYFLTPSQVANTKSPEQTELSTDEMKDKLSAEGFQVLTEEEWVEELAAVEAAKQEELKQENDKKEEQKESTSEEKEVIYRTVLNVASGMTSIDVGNALVTGKIIDNAMTFYKEVEKRGLANELRPGTFELDSEMTMDEVINTIFK